MYLLQSSKKKRWLSILDSKKSKESSSNKDTIAESETVVISSSSSPRIQSAKTRWMLKQVISRDKKHKLKTRVVYASFDQMTRRFSGEDACSAIAVLTASWLLTNPRREAPGKTELDKLIKRGAAAWRTLCTSHGMFRNRHFDIETVVNAGLGPVALCAEKSHVGFFPGLGFDDVSVDRMWDRICDDVAASEEDRVYIVSWNDHFFVMKAGKEAFYVVDSLGARLSLGCRTGYALKFEAESRIDGNGEWMTVVEGKDCCKEFYKRFLFAAVEMSLETNANNPLLYKKLQIEFHCVQLPSK